ncbi:MAG: hypothetical protein R6V14_09110 [Halanaerobiales bacterium]
MFNEDFAFNIEEGIYIPGEFGVRVEDIVVVTDNGRELLNKYPNEIIEIYKVIRSIKTFKLIKEWVCYRIK